MSGCFIWISRTHMATHALVIIRCRAQEALSIIPAATFSAMSDKIFHP